MTVVYSTSDGSIHTTTLTPRLTISNILTDQTTIAGGKLPQGGLVVTSINGSPVGTGDPAHAARRGAGGDDQRLPRERGRLTVDVLHERHRVRDQGRLSDQQRDPGRVDHGRRSGLQWRERAGGGRERFQRDPRLHRGRVHRDLRPDRAPAPGRHQRARRDSPARSASPRRPQPPPTTDSSDPNGLRLVDRLHQHEPRLREHAADSVPRRRQTALHPHRIGAPAAGSIRRSRPRSPRSVWRSSSSSPCMSPSET